MDSVLINCDAEHEPDLASRLPPEFATHAVDAERTAIASDGRPAYLDRYGADLSDWEDAEQDQITARIARPIVYALSCSDIRFVRDLLFAMADDAKLLIDNDHGVLLSGREFAARMRAEPGWDWRRDILPRT